MSRPAVLSHTVLAVLLGLATACSAGEDPAADPGAPAAPASEGRTGAQGQAAIVPLEEASVGAPDVTEAPSPPHRAVEITSPADGATVASPVTLEVEVEGFTLAPVDGTFEDDSGHLYAYLDRPLPTSQDRIPEDPDVVRFSETTVQLPELEPGEHTISVIAAHGYPVPMMPVVADEVTVTVE